MKLLSAGSIWCVCAFGAVYVQSSFLHKSFRCRKQDANNEEETEPIYSVLKNNLISCALTCFSNDTCSYFVYNRHIERCDGYGDGEDKDCDDGSDHGAMDKSADGRVQKDKCMMICEAGMCDNEVEEDGTAGVHVVYKKMYKKRCQKKKAEYKISFKTGNERNAGTKADLLLTITGTCGEFGAEIKYGKNITPRRGSQSTLKFITDSVCTVDTVSVAFVDLCHTDDWFIEYIEVNYEEMETSEGIVILFNTYYWFTAHGDEDQTTGITCVIAASGAAHCSPCQRCE